MVMSVGRKDQRKPHDEPDGKKDEAARHEQEMLDEEIEESFPASDPPSATQPKREKD